MINGRLPRNQPSEDEIDPILQGYNPSELRTASEFLSNWLPFLSKGLCDHCSHSISHRVRSLYTVKYDAEQPHQGAEVQVSTSNRVDINDTKDTNSLGSWKDGANGALEQIEETLGMSLQSPEHVKSPRPRMSWAVMSQEETDADEEEEADRQFGNSSSQLEETGGEVKTTRKPELSREQRERIRFMNVKRKKDFICLERVGGKSVNILDGLELHAGVFSAVEQKKIVDFVYELREKGKNGKLKERTYTAPQKWMRGKGRVTIQFGCCYNYATDRNGNPPGILQSELVDPIPQLFKVIIKRLVKWHVLPPTCVPDSCIVNIYDEGDCIPPHIDNHDFLRPFCTVSFLSDCIPPHIDNHDFLRPFCTVSFLFFGHFAQFLREFSGAFAIPLPVGSILVLNGNGADVVKHCVPAVSTKRISITFRKMDESKWPVGFIPEPDLQGLEPLVYEADKPKGGSYISKPGLSNRQVNRRDDPIDTSRGLLGSQPHFYGQSQTRHQGPSPGNRKKARS